MNADWKSIDTAPSDGTYILLWERKSGIYIGLRDNCGWEPQRLRCHGCCGCQVDYTPVPAYWAELPDDSDCKDMWFNKGECAYRSKERLEIEEARKLENRLTLEMINPAFKKMKVR